jgi:hypothetical protein
LKPRRYVASFNLRLRWQHLHNYVRSYSVSLFVDPLDSPLFFGLFIMKHAPISARRSPAIALRQAQNSPGHLALALGGTLIALSAASSAATRVAVKLQGDIEPACAISSNFASGAALDVAAVVDVPDITKAGSRNFSFTVDCNAPFQYRLEAKYGALTHSDDGVAAKGFAVSVPYDVAIHIPTDGAAINDRCSGESIGVGKAGCRFSNSGNGIALASRSNLLLAWAPEGILMAGEYTDKLTITVGVRQ